MPKQVQIRGAAQATQEARTLVSRELDINMTDERLAVHNGSAAGGIPHVNWRDEQNGEFVYGSTTGTDAITVTLNKAPAAYAAGQMFRFKAAATTIGAATINFNSLGALTLKKKDIASGTLVATAAGDIIAGGFYIVHVIDGSNALLESSSIADSGQVLIETQTASTSPSLDFEGLSGYSSYKMVIKNITLSAVQNVSVRLGTGATPTYQTANYQYSNQGYNASGTEVRNNNSSTGSAVFTPNIVDNDVNIGVSAEIYFYDLHGSKYKMMTWTVTYQDSSNNFVTSTGGGAWYGTTDITAIRIYVGAVNIVDGSATLYGLT